MYQLRRKYGEIDNVLNQARRGQDNGTVYPGMSYEDGVTAAIDWLTGYTDDPPFDPEESDEEENPEDQDNGGN